MIGRKFRFAPIVLFVGACSGDASAPSEPATVAIHAGDGQEAAVGTVVGVPPAVVVRAEGGEPVRGVPVTFAIAGGGGEIQGSSPLTNADGVATLDSWRLGTAAGQNTLRVTVPGLTPLTFEAIGLSGPPAMMSAHAGSDLQTGSLGTAVTVQPAVRIGDEYGNAVEGIPVDFVIDRGGGSLEGATPITAVDGIAAVDNWTLGQPGSNTITASIDASGIELDPITFFAHAFAMFTAVPIEGANQPPAHAGVTYNRTRGTLTAVAADYGIGEIPAHGGSWTKLTNSAPGWGWSWAVIHEDRQQILYMSEQGGPYTWTYATGAWTDAVQGEAPSARSYPAMVYDAMNLRILLYGGVVSGASSHPVGDMYAWDGDVWARLEDPVPGPRAGHGMAYQPESNRVIVHGGLTAGSIFSGQAARDTWIFHNDGTWERQSGGLPKDLVIFGMAYDEARETLVVAGGNELTESGGYWLSADVWEMVGDEWLLSTAQTPVGPRNSPTLVFTSAAPGLLLFGHRYGRWNDVWLYGDRQ